MPIYILLEYSKNYYMTSRSLWDFYRYEIDDFNDAKSKQFKYKTKIIEKRNRIT